MTTAMAPKNTITGLKEKKYVNPTVLLKIILAMLTLFFLN
jgi:hypothetical protein